jgi:hypothetical protein
MNELWFPTVSPYYRSNPRDVIAPVADTRTVTLLDDLLPLFKKHARITVTSDDDLCLMYLSGAIRSIEQIIAMCVEPRAFSWTPYEQGAQSYALPFRNVFLPPPATSQGTKMFSIEPDAAQVTIEPPAAWPVVMEVGYADGAAMPLDLKMAVLQLAASYYEGRGTYELGPAYLQQWVEGQLTRYLVPRV